MDSVDYRSVLKKYMEYVGHCEGIYYARDNGSYTEAELKALREVEAELEAEEEA